MRETPQPIYTLTLYVYILSDQYGETVIIALVRTQGYFLLACSFDQLMVNNL